MLVTSVTLVLRKSLFFQPLKGIVNIADKEVRSVVPAKRNSSPHTFN